MRRGTTPTIALTCEELNFTQMKSLYITFCSAWWLEKDSTRE